MIVGWVSSECVCVSALGLSPERFCSAPLQGDASYHGSNISPLNLSLFLPSVFLYYHIFLSLFLPFFSLQSFIPPSLFVSALPHSLPPPSSITVSRPPAYIYMAQLVLGQALSSLAATYGKLVHIPPQCCPPIPPFTLNAGRFHDPPSSFHFCCWSQFAPHFYCVTKDTLLHVLCVICVTTHIFLKYILYNYSRRNFWKWSAVVSLFTSSSAPLTLCFLIHQSRQSRGVVTFTSLQQHSAHTPYERHVSGLHTSEDNGLEMLSHIKQAHVFLPDTFGCVTKKGQNRINCR